MAKQRGSSIPSSQRYTRRDFQAEFPDDDACLEWLKNRLYPDGIHCVKCQRVTRHHRVASRKSYSCQHCGHHVHPTSGTIFHKSSTSLQDWFYAIFLMSQTRCGISAKQLQREIGVTYKTAWRMFNQIRSLMAEDDDNPSLGGQVEADETYVGGKPRASVKLTQAQHWARKTVVFGAVERGGSVRATIIPDASSRSLRAALREYVLPETTLYTDEWRGYDKITGQYFEHRRIRHAAKIYVDGDVTTNTIEGFFGLVKNGLRGVYHSVGTRHLQSYLDEYAFRYNRRSEPQPMFKLILASLSRRAQPSA